ELTSKNPAKIFGIKNKGLLKEGYDADLVIISMRKRKKVDNAALRTKCGWSPFHGTMLQGWPILTMVNGKVIFCDGLISEIPGCEVGYHEL
ncbi:amidohydrolase family protein, partial [Candidatus Woesearchaeota archaeon]|nr:amidohydrolase family protein [Candidatus Woesearchaeota archaeon]